MKYNFINCLILGENYYFPQNLERKNYILYFNYEIIIYSHISYGSATGAKPEGGEGGHLPPLTSPKKSIIYMLM